MTRKNSNPLRQLIVENRIPAAISQVNEAFKGKDGSVYWRHAGKTYKKGADGQKKEIGEQEYIAAKSPKDQALAAKRGRTNINTTDGTPSKSIKQPIASSQSAKPTIPLDDLVDAWDFDSDEEIEHEKRRLGSFFSDPSKTYDKGSDAEKVSRAHPSSLFNIEDNSSFEIPYHPRDWEVSAKGGNIRIDSFKTGERLATFPAHSTEKLLDSQKKILRMAKATRPSA
jgi:hypothetical protein